MIDQRVGGWAFILGVIIAIVAGLAAGYLDAVTAAYVTLVLVILGLIVGFLNLNDKEVQPFLVAAIALMLMQITAGGLNLIPYVGVYLASMVQKIAMFVMPAALVVALKFVYKLAARPS